MIWYQTQLAWRSMRKNPGLSLLMIVAIGFGVAAAMVTYTSHHLMQSNPLAHKDSLVAMLQTDAWHEREPFPGRQKKRLVRRFD
jgi:putative ABC transport system permease protein